VSLTRSVHVKHAYQEGMRHSQGRLSAQNAILESTQMHPYLFAPIALMEHTLEKLKQQSAYLVPRDRTPTALVALNALLALLGTLW